MQARVQYMTKWKKNPQRVFEIMGEASEEWVLIQTELRDRAKEGSTPNHWNLPTRNERGTRVAKKTRTNRRCS